MPYLVATLENTKRKIFSMRCRNKCVPILYVHVYGLTRIKCYCPDPVSNKMYKLAYMYVRPSNGRSMCSQWFKTVQTAGAQTNLNLRFMHMPTCTSWVKVQKEL